MPDDLLEIICILERGEKQNPYKIIRKRNYFSLITKFPAKNGESTPLKNCASARGTATHQDKREFSSDDKLPNKRRKRRRNKSSHVSRSASQQQDKKLKDSSDVRLAQQKPKKKSSARGASQHTDKSEHSSDVQLAQPKPKKKSPAQVARDRARRREFWKRMRFPRQLRAENLALHYRLLAEVLCTISIIFIRRKPVHSPPWSVSQRQRTPAAWIVHLMVLSHTSCKKQRR